MPGTILAKLSATPQADNTTITAGNSGFTSVQVPGSGTTAFHLAAAKMGQTEGYRFTQSGAAQVFGYWDFASTSIFAFRLPIKMPSLPTASATLFRAYTATDHVTALWSINILTSGRVQFVETAGGGLNVTSASGSPMVAGTEYVLMGLCNQSTGAMTIRCFPKGSTTALFEITGTLTTLTPTPSARFGIGTNSSIASFDTNDTAAVGSGDWLDRADVDLQASAVATPTRATAPFICTCTITASGGTGTPKVYSWDWGDGATTPEQSGNAASHSYAAAGDYTLTWSVRNT